jgi:dTMP kinase
MDNTRQQHTNRDGTMTPEDRRFIVLEGLDGAGTTTQARRLYDYLTTQGRDSFLTFEPTSEPIGAFTRDLLSQETPPSQRVLGLLFAADRLSHTDVINRHLEAGRDVICDRYVFSSIAYQTLDPDISAEWVHEVNRGCALPDMTIFVDVPVDVCLSRIASRAGGRTIYERTDRLETIFHNYQRLFDFYRQHYGTLVTIDGTLSPDEVHEAIIAAL